MAGSKRNKMKKVFSPSKALAPSDPPDSINDDDALMDDLFAQLDSKDKTVQEQSAAVLQEADLTTVADNLDSAAKKDGKNRFKARQARKAASLAEQYVPVDADADAQLEREAHEEERAITQTCDELGLKMYEINPDGHCLFSAVADQLSILGVIPASQATYALTRQAAAEYIKSHADDFIPFLPSIGGEDGTNATSEGLMSPQEFAQYCDNVKNTGVWGGEPEIQALSRAYNVPIHVIQGGKPRIVVHNPSDAPPSEDTPVVRISYHRRMYGLGEHYNSLRPKRSLTDGLKAIFTGSSPPS